jgi:beta-lactamase regulating signal transducer with metallopeptidase domain
MSDLQGLESLACAWAARGWLALLAFTVAVLAVACLRVPIRRLFGPERAFQLWLLPPLAVLASQLPHGAATPASLPSLVYAITSAAGAPMRHAEIAGTFDWRVAAALLWLAGWVTVLAATIATQRRYRDRLRGATPLPQPRLRWPVLLAADVDLGPALVGAWRCRIVLPADFTRRYDATEQALILAHESAHARRGDGWWSLLAHALVAPLWFHPLAWWALAALRLDQELACDAAVLREHGSQRRSYASAMLKTQPSALALPAGSTWSPRHPLKERIAMMKQKPISVPRRWAGRVALVAFVVAVTGVAYAATTPAADPVAADHYSLQVSVSFDGQRAQQLEKMCLKPGVYGNVDVVGSGAAPWQGRVAVLPAKAGLLELRIDLSGGTLDKPVHPIVQTLPGQKATVEVAHGAPYGEDRDVRGGFPGIKLELTPGIGC